MRILLIDDHAIVRAGLQRLLATIADAVIDEAATGAQALARMRAAPPNVILLDLNLPDLGGLELLARLRREPGGEAARIIVLTMHGEALYARRAMQAGAQGYLTKNAAPDEILAAVLEVARGGRYIERAVAQAMALGLYEPDAQVRQLSSRQLEILRLLSGGRSLSQIAAALGVSYKTVANSCSLIKSQLGATRTADLVRLAIELGV